MTTSVKDYEDQIKANVEKQLSELEILQSIYPNSNELVIEDENAVRVAQAFLQDDQKLIDSTQLLNIGFAIRFTADVRADETSIKPKMRDDEDEGQYIQVKEIETNRMRVPYFLNRLAVTVYQDSVGDGLSFAQTLPARNPSGRVRPSTRPKPKQTLLARLVQVRQGLASLRLCHCKHHRMGQTKRGRLLEHDRGRLAQQHHDGQRVDAVRFGFDQ